MYVYIYIHIKALHGPDNARSWRPSPRAPARSPRWRPAEPWRPPSPRAPDQALEVVGAPVFRLLSG